MKNQYFGDVGDYGKYAMLRFLANNGIKIAVNWYLTPNDGSNDGKYIAYLEKNSMRRYDAELFDLLSEMIGNGCRDVLKFEERDVIQNAIYYHNVLDTEGMSKDEMHRYRAEWHRVALDACADAELVYLDPDNGAYDGEPTKTKDTMKYCYADEIADYYNRGQNVVYYCSKGRRSFEQWEETKSLMQRKLPDARLVVITFHKGTQRSYIFVLHNECFRKYSEIIKKFLYKWQRIFTEDFGTFGSLTGQKTGEKITLVDSKGVSVTVEETEDGWVNIRFSDQKNCSYRISIEHFISRLR